jgi:FkbM family methyltransferase
MWSKRRALDMVVIAIVAAVLGFVAGAYEPLHRKRAIALGLVGAYELMPLGERFTTRQSTYAEEWIFRDFFREQREGVFVDIGAGHYRDGSNTYFLETERGWRGIAVDAQERYAADYRSHRPATRFFPLFVSDVSDADVRLHVPDTFPYAASDNRDFASAHRRGGEISDVRVPTITLNDLLKRERIERIDLLVMDIELAEPRALAGFDIDRYRPRLVCIESHPQNRQALLNYFYDHRYVVVGKYLRMDTQNLYFTPSPN